MDQMPGGARPAAEPELQVWAELPDGYTALPLTDIGGALEGAAALVTELAPESLRAAVAPTTAALDALLRDLAERGAGYCGLGRHRSAQDGTEITSTLVVTVQDTGATGDPRQLLGELASRRDGAAGEQEAELVELAGRPVLFCEGVRELPTPFAEDESATTPVFVIEALLPSPDARLLAAVEFATPFVGHGPEFRMMLAQFTASIGFEAPVESPVSGIRAALG